jgi:hypothetical protein
MACPYFDPVQPRTSLPESQTSMLPLGDLWVGICTATPEHRAPGDADLKPFCNLGYARGACTLFPAADGPDAVRFTISSDEGRTIRIYYVVERDHYPHAHGALVYSADLACLLDGPPPQSTLAHQACAYAQSYLRRKSK